MIQPVAAVSLGYPTLAPPIRAAAPPRLSPQQAEPIHLPAAVSVKLSLAAEIRILQSQGVSIHNIALRLGLDNVSVTKYLA